MSDIIPPSGLVLHLDANEPLLPPEVDIEDIEMLLK